jgi:hypothetical protein
LFEIKPGTPIASYSECQYNGMAPAVVELPCWDDLPAPPASPGPIESELWQRFCNESIRWRVTKDKYQQLAKELLTEERIPSPLLVKYVLDGQIDGDITADPLLCNYVEVLLDMDAFDLSHLLQGTYLRSSHRMPPAQDGTPRNCSDMDTKMIFLAATRIITGKAPKSPREARAVLDTLPAWLAAAAGSHGAMNAFDHQFALWAESVGVLAISILENQRFVGIIDHAWNESQSVLATMSAADV